VPQVLLAFAIRGGDTIAIPRSGRKQHTLDNAAADRLTLSEEELTLIDREFPAPKSKTYLDIV
jgi:diketogulonate reductase-like aldo/keto reductase